MVLSLGTVCVFVTFVVYSAYIVTFVDIIFLTETWLRPSGDEAKCADLAQLGYSVHSFPRSPGVAGCRGGGIALIVTDSLKWKVSCSTSFPFYHSCLEVAQLTFTLHNQQ